MASGSGAAAGPSGQAPSSAMSSGPVKVFQASSSGGSAKLAAGGSSKQPPSPDILQDLCSRFVLNASSEELSSFERIFFLVEQAHWFYEDQVADNSSHLKSLSLRDHACHALFQHCPSLRPYAQRLPELYKEFTTYKLAVPVMGAMILNKTLDKCLLVRGFKPGSTWGFPRGKINKDEQDAVCAVREVFEETSIHTWGKFQETDYVEVVVGQQRSRLYIVPFIDENTPVNPQTKKEIGEIAWHPVDDLPEASNGKAPNGHRYYMVWPFVRQLKQWIALRKQPSSTTRNRKSKASMPPQPATTQASYVGPAASVHAESLSKGSAKSKPRISTGDPVLDAKLNATATGKSVATAAPVAASAPTVNVVFHDPCAGVASVPAVQEPAAGSVSVLSHMSSTGSSVQATATSVTCASTALRSFRFDKDRILSRLAFPD
eukprot:jgi/Chlat1/5246/Chrsp33S05009